MFQDAMDLTNSGLFELRRRLEAYADARLTPSLDATIRMRAYVMTAAHRRAALVAADRTFDAAGPTTAARVAERSRAATNPWRRPAAALVAASLAVALLAGTVYAAKPGGLLYDTRIWIEMANLPADVVARAQAEVGRLDARIQEAQQASTAGDGPATLAALSAYSRIVIEAGEGSAGNATASAAIEIAVGRHVVVLTLMADTVPAPARAAIQQALSSSTKVLDDLQGADKTESRDRPIDGDLSGTTGADDRTKPARPSQANGNPPGGAVEDKSKPVEDKSKPDKGARESESPPPAQSGPGGAGKGPPAHPTATPIPERKPAGSPKPGET
jgi:hypothetical protein